MPHPLEAILGRYGDPDRALVSQLPKGGTMLDYMGHAEVTRALIEIDPSWSWEPVAFDERGLPAISERNGNLELWIRLTLHGVSRLGVGTCKKDKPDASKELIGDAIRNAGMRFGVALALWSKAEWHDKPTASGTQTVVVNNTVTQEVIADPFEWAHEEMLHATNLTALDAVAALAKKRLTPEQRAELRPLYLERKAELEEEAAR